MFSTSGEYHDYIGGGGGGGFLSTLGMLSTLEGYHDYMITSGDIMIHVGELIDKSL